MSEDESRSEQEQRQAEALARALERGTVEEAPPDDALETAALLRYRREGGELGEDRRHAILEQVWSEARAPQPGAERKWGGLKWLVPAGGLAAAAAVAVVLLTDAAQTPGETAKVPAPGPGLLRAQADAAGGAADAASALDRRMNDYRGEVYAALQERYGR